MRDEMACAWCSRAQLRRAASGKSVGVAGAFGFEVVAFDVVSVFCFLRGGIFEGVEKRERAV
jgi:hypothetical protein